MDQKSADYPCIFPVPERTLPVRNVVAFSLGRCQSLDRAIQEQRQLSMEDKCVSQALPCTCSSSYIVFFFNPEHGYPPEIASQYSQADIYSLSWKHPVDLLW